MREVLPMREEWKKYLKNVAGIDIAFEENLHSYFLFRYSTTTNIAITNRHPRKKTNPGCAAIVFAIFVKISGAAWLAAPLSSAEGCTGTGVAVALALHAPADVGAGTIGVEVATGID